MKLITVFERNELEALQPAILVECWKRVNQSGSNRRKYHAAFTEEERETIAIYYKIFTKWHLSTGIPNNHAMPISTYQLMKRAIDFFATV